MKEKEALETSLRAISTSRSTPARQKTDDISSASAVSEGEGEVSGVEGEEETKVEEKEENGGELVHVGDLRALDVMGENALVSCSGPEEVAHFRSATVTVVSDLVQTLELRRSEFEALKDSGVLGAEFTEKVQSIKQERERMNEALRRQNQGISA